MTQWQPIETAPLDGTPVLLLLERPVDANDLVGWYPWRTISVVVGWAESAYPQGTSWACGFHGEGSYDSDGSGGSPDQINIRPAKWMPIPCA